MPISFGDRVRILATPVTEAAGVAGLVGTVFGETRPSVSGVQVLGALQQDYALNVSLEERPVAVWLSPDLVEFLDHQAGLTFRLKDVPKEWVRTQDGGWRETERRPPSLWQRVVSRLRGRGGAA